MQADAHISFAMLKSGTLYTLYYATSTYFDTIIAQSYTEYNQNEHNVVCVEEVAVMI
jgi:hypothetical protein